jgi:shingomyelin synthase
VIVKRVFVLMSGMGLSINGKHIYCGDYIFSGHTMVLTLGFLVIKECKRFFNRAGRSVGRIRMRE